MKILVVDDNNDICELLKNILLSEGYDVDACCNPLMVKDIIAKEKPELIITDMLMSGVDGRVLAKNLRENSETEDIKIMLMSAHPDAKVISKNEGIDEFLAKPFEIEELVAKVENLLA